MRSHRDILDSYLVLRAAGKLEEDLEINNARDIVVIDRYCTNHGFDGVRRSAAILAESLGDATFTYQCVEVVDRTGYLIWTAHCNEKMLVHRGVDFFRVNDDRIRAQTIDYHVHSEH